MPNVNEQTLKDILADFGLTVRKKRIQLGFSQEELAYRSGLHRTYVTDIERGARNVSLDSIMKLARALEVSLTELFANIEKNRFDKIQHLSARQFSSKAFDILLVDDDPKHIEITIHALQKNGVTNPIQVAHTGEEALEIIFNPKESQLPGSAFPPTMIMLDLALPNMSGIEVLRAIRNDKRTESLPVIIFTASRSDQDYKESIKLGVTAYITKPVDFLELSNVVPKIGLGWLLVGHL